MPRRLTREGLARRFWAQVDKGGKPDSECPHAQGWCWLWTGPYRGGMPTLSVRGRIFTAVRVATELEVGPTDGTHSRNLCGREDCCRPSHWAFDVNGSDAKRGRGVLSFLIGPSAVGARPLAPAPLALALDETPRVIAPPAPAPPPRAVPIVERGTIPQDGAEPTLAECLALLDVPGFGLVRSSMSALAYTPWGNLSEDDAGAVLRQAARLRRAAERQGGAAPGRAA